MATLEQLKSSITDLPVAEAQQLILDLRHQRRTWKPPQKKKASSSGKVAKMKQQPLQIEQMDASSLEALIDILEGAIKK